MSTLRHGEIDVDVPDEWSDQSTLVFVAPGDAPETLSIRFAAAQGRTAEQLAHAEMESLSRLESHVHVAAEGPFTCGLGEGFRVEIRVHLESVEMTQAVYAVIVDPRAVVATATAVIATATAVIATATAATQAFERAREKIENTIASLRPAK